MIEDINEFRKDIVRKLRQLLVNNGNTEIISILKHINFSILDGKTDIKNIINELRNEFPNQIEYIDELENDLFPKTTEQIFLDDISNIGKISKLDLNFYVDKYSDKYPDLDKNYIKKILKNSKNEKA